MAHETLLINDSADATGDVRVATLPNLDVVAQGSLDFSLVEAPAEGGFLPPQLERAVPHTNALRVVVLIGGDIGAFRVLVEEALVHPECSPA
jgi:hypothetical protein